MRPLSTVYRLVDGNDRDKIERLWATTDIPKFPTSFPEIVAERDGEIIGFVARRHDEQGILIEPMICNSAIVYVRLVFAMEAALKASGVTTYLFRVEPHRIRFEQALKKMVKRGQVKDKGYQGGYFWFERSIQNGYS